MTSLDELLAGADFPTREVSICLKGSLLSAWEEANGVLVRAQAAYETAAEKNLPMVYPTQDRDEAADRLRAIEAEMEAASVKVRMTALSTTAYQALTSLHPPRVEDDGSPNMVDARMGFNVQTFFKPLIRACTVAPNMTDDQFERLCDRLTYRQFDLLAGTAYSLNKETDGQIPFSSAASGLTRSSGETSNSPDSSESASDDSGATGGPGRKAPKGSQKRSGTRSPVT